MMEALFETPEQIELLREGEARETRVMKDGETAPMGI
jgi:hypothetical protein